VSAVLHACEALRQREYVLPAKLIGLEQEVLTVGPTTP
jgi:hypothetical protein